MILFFPDNTVLINFAIIDRMDLLETLANRNGRWCLAVANECHRSARTEGLGQLSEAAHIFGAPLVPDSAERLDARTLRDGMAKPGDDPLRHLGEAETLAVITRRRMHREAIFVTDDGAAQILAGGQDVRTVDTWDLLDLAVRTEKIDQTERQKYHALLAQAGRKRSRQRRTESCPS